VITIDFDQQKNCDSHDCRLGEWRLHRATIGHDGERPREPKRGAERAVKAEAEVDRSGPLN
jgi:hypothetical protein